jgi:hypothetical protein
MVNSGESLSNSAQAQGSKYVDKMQLDAKKKGLQPKEKKCC